MLSTRPKIKSSNSKLYFGYICGSVGRICVAFYLIYAEGLK